MQLHFHMDGEEVAVEVTREGDDWRLAVNGRPLDMDVAPDGEGGWFLTDGSGRHRLLVAGKGGDLQVFRAGRVRQVSLHDPDQEEDEAVAGGPVVTAAMPGKIVRVLVAEGDEVEEGQTVVIMESMKMETDLTAAVAGLVAKVHVENDQIVGQGDPLVDIAPAEDPA